MSLGKLDLFKGYSDKGANMGRATLMPADPNIKIKLRLAKLRIDRGGYDDGGAYWGKPNNVYLAQSTEEVPMQYGNDCIIQLSFRGDNREEVKKKVLSILPNATFYR